MNLYVKENSKFTILNPMLFVGDFVKALWLIINTKGKKNQETNQQRKSNCRMNNHNIPPYKIVIDLLNFDY